MLCLLLALSLLSRLHGGEPALDGPIRALLHELQVEDGVIRLPRRAEFEFLRRFGEVAASADAVWPPIKQLERK